MEEFRTPLSRAEAILENILGADNRLRDPLSNVEEILLSILNDTPYEKEPETLIEEMLLAIKEGTEMDAIAKNRVEEILLAIIHGEEYTKLPLSRFEELLIKWLKESAVTEKFLDFAPILTFSDSAGKPLTEGKVKIEPVQDLHGYDNPWPAGGGANLWGDTVMANDIATKTGVTVNYQNKTVDIFATGGDEVNLTDGIEFEENTQYTFILDGSVTGFGNLMFVYTDGTNDRGLNRYFSVGANVSASGKTVAGLYKRRYSSSTTIKYETSGLFKGVKTTSEFTPYSNICPISGHEEVSVVRCGKNLWHSDVVTKDSHLTKRDGVMICTGTPSIVGTTVLLGSPAEPINFKLPAGTYTLTGTSETFSGIYAELVDGTTWQGTKTFPNGAIIKRIRCVNAMITNGEYYWQLQIEKGSATSYEPYQGNTYTIELGDTIYGGTLDVTKGELTVDRAMVDLGSLSWSARASGEQNALYSSSLPQEYVPDYSLLRGWICDTYVENSPSSAAILQQNVDSRNIGLYSYRSTGAKSTTFYLITPKTASPQGTLVYELATPQTIQLTPQQITTLLGNNTLYADTGDISVKYLAKK